MQPPPFTGSPSVAHAVDLPSSGVPDVIHLKVLPPSRECQIQLVSDESEPGPLVYTRWGSVGSSRRSCSKPTPPMPLMTGCPKVGGPEVVVAKLSTTSEPPIAQRMKTRKMRRVEIPDSEPGFFFII